MALCKKVKFELNLILFLYKSLTYLSVVLHDFFVLMKDRRWFGVRKYLSKIEKYD